MCKTRLRALSEITELLHVRQKKAMMLYVHANMHRKALTMPIRIFLITGDKKLTRGSEAFSVISLEGRRVCIIAGASYPYSVS